MQKYNKNFTEKFLSHFSNSTSLYLAEYIVHNTTIAIASPSLGAFFSLDLIALLKFFRVEKFRSKDLKTKQDQTVNPI